MRMALDVHVGKIKRGVEREARLLREEPEPEPEPEF
jgi:hypothetical protein